MVKTIQESFIDEYGKDPALYHVTEEYARSLKQTEARIARMLATGDKTIKEIGEIVEKSPNTIRQHEYDRCKHCYYRLVDLREDPVDGIFITVDSDLCYGQPNVSFYGSPDTVMHVWVHSLAKTRCAHFLKIKKSSTPDSIERILKQSTDQIRRFYESRSINALINLRVSLSKNVTKYRLMSLDDWMREFGIRFMDLYKYQQIPSLGGDSVTRKRKKKYKLNPLVDIRARARDTGVCIDKRLRGDWEKKLVRYEHAREIAQSLRDWLLENV